MKNLDYNANAKASMHICRYANRFETLSNAEV
jgi:hypothetical protein